MERDRRDCGGLAPSTTVQPPRPAGAQTQQTLSRLSADSGARRRAWTLDRLEHAFGEREASEERLRRFVADASHELRTPLASIRGYADLYEMGASRERADIDKAMRRIGGEAARMGTLVDALLTLARLEDLTSAPHVGVDVAGLVRDAADDARATQPTATSKSTSKRTRS
jgi:signal transduction histidine kinase